MPWKKLTRSRYCGSGIHDVTSLSAYGLAKTKMSTRSSVLAPDAFGPTLAIGEILVEIMATSTGSGFLEPIELLGPFPSGAPAIFIDQCARLGGSAAIVGTVGNDDFGKANIDRLNRDGVDISAIAVDPTVPTGSAFVRYRPDGSRDFIYNIATSAAALMKWTPEVASLVRRTGHLHVMGTVFTMPCAWEITARALSIIKRRGGSVSLDPNLRKELLVHGQTRQRLRELVEISDIVLASDDELTLVAGADDEDAAVQSLFDLGVGEVVIKRGKNGSTWFGKGGGHVESPAFVVEEVDATGAGDCFGGSYIACRRLGMEPTGALDYANAAGARNVTRRGPMEGAGTREELDTFIAATQRVGV